MIRLVLAFLIAASWIGLWRGTAESAEPSVTATGPYGHVHFPSLTPGSDNAIQLLSPSLVVEGVAETQVSGRNPIEHHLLHDNSPAFIDTSQFRELSGPERTAGFVRLDPNLAFPDDPIDVWPGHSTGVDLRQIPKTTNVRLTSISELDDDLPPLEEELWYHGGSYLYAPEGDRLFCHPSEGVVHSQALRLPEDWEKPRPLTAFQEFIGADPIRPWCGLKWFGEEGFQWEPRFVGYGSYELFGVAIDQNNQRDALIGHQLLVDLDLRLTGTERFHMQFRPLGRKNTGGSAFRLTDPSGYVDNSTGIPDRWWFEFEWYSVFGGILDDPFKPRDFHFTVGKFPFSLQNNLLINDDITGIAINKNTLLVEPFSNVNILGFYGLDDVDAIGGASSETAGVNVSADYHHAFLEVAYAYLDHSAGSGADANYAAFSLTKLYGAATIAVRELFKWGDQDVFGNGQLYVLETNLSRHFSHEFQCRTGFEHAVYYLNVFHANDGWTPISGGNFDRLRSTFEINPLVAISSGRRPVDTTGVALGAQLFRHHDDQSLIPELVYESPTGDAVWGGGLTYQRKITARSFLQARGVVAVSGNDLFDREGIFVSTFIIF